MKSRYYRNGRSQKVLIIRLIGKLGVSLAVAGARCWHALAPFQPLPARPAIRAADPLFTKPFPIAWLEFTIAVYMNGIVQRVSLRKFR